MSNEVTTRIRRRNRQSNLDLSPEQFDTDTKSIVKLEAEEDSQQDEVYIVVVKEEQDQLELKYEKQDELEYPAYNHDQPFELHIPEVKIEYDGNVYGPEGSADQNILSWHDENNDPDYMVDEQDNTTNDGDNMMNDSTKDTDYVVSDEEDAMEDSDYLEDNEYDSSTSKRKGKGKRGKSEDTVKRWICGSKPDEKKLLELMQADPPPLPDPLPYYLKFDGMFRCKLCKYTKPKEGPCIRHYRTKHSPRFIYCFACGATFTQQAGLYRHEERNCRAPGIKVVRRLRSSLMQNQVWRKRCGRSEGILSGPSLSGKPVCPHCDLDCGTAQQLRKHEEQVHINIRPFRCHFCPASYSVRRSYYGHLQTHSKEKRICCYCSKTFTKRDTLILHMRIHEEKRYKCSHCPMAFTYNKTLQRHIARHTGAPPPHPCKFCGSGFWRIDFLRTHMEMVHGYSIITKKKLSQMFPRMTSEEINDSMKGKAVRTTRPPKLSAPETDSDDNCADETFKIALPDEKKSSSGVKKSPGVEKLKVVVNLKSPKVGKLKKSSEVEKSSGVEKSRVANSKPPKVAKLSGVKKSPVVEKPRVIVNLKSLQVENLSGVKKSPEVEKSSGVKKSRVVTIKGGGKWR